MEDLFDIFNVKPIEVVEEEVSQPKKKQKVVDKKKLLETAKRILNNEYRQNYSLTVLQDHKDLEDMYESCLQLSYEPYSYQKISGVVIDSLFGLNKVDLSNILVSSPTGSGKTFLIKHAAVRASQTQQKLIIGVPLVALAEQTYFELKKLLKEFDKNDPEFSPVGIRTGPSEMFPDANVLVCTYEIISIELALSMDFLNNVPTVILDEIHFMTDRDRGARVEYIASSLPDTTGLIGLSGTIPNAVEFAHSMSRATNRPTRLVGLKDRPIKLRYYCHLGGKLCELCYHDIPGSVKTRFKTKAWNYVTRTIEKRPKRLNYNQTRGRIIQLVRDLQNQDKLPAMVVSFSCKMLNQLGKHLNSIDLINNNSQKSYIHQQFQEVKKRVGDKEWGLFKPLVELACRGIGIHHSQNPKLYLEILPRLSQKGLMPLVLATSSLSTGIDLPVRSIVILSLIQPTSDGFKPIETSLLQQIFGRAGRPGQEKEGNAIIAMWTKLDPRVNVPLLLCAESKPVVGHGMVKPREIITNKIHHKTPHDLLMSPFSSRDFSHIYPVIEDLKSVQEETSEVIQRIRDIEEVRTNSDISWRYIDNLIRHVKKGDLVIVDPDQDSKPFSWTVTSTKPLKCKEYEGSIPNNWIFDCKPPRCKNHCHFEDLERMKETRSIIKRIELGESFDIKTMKDAYDTYEEHNILMQLKKMVSVTSHPLYSTYETIVKKLSFFDFLDKDGIVTFKGRMVPGILGCEDPLCLVESWCKNILPRDTEENFASSLTCFLQNHRHNQPADHTGIYAKLCQLQKHIGDENDLGTNMMEPIRTWVKGNVSIFEICQMYDYASPGHVSKTIQRLIQLLEQLQEAANRIGDNNLEELCERTINKTKRGLPFLISMYLK